MSRDAADEFHPQTGHLRLLNSVLRVWRTARRWPTFAEIDKELDQNGLDALALLRPMNPTYVLCSGGSYPQGDSELTLTVPGLALIPEGSSVGSQFVAAVRFLAGVERAHSPAPDFPYALVTSDDLAEYFESSIGVPRPHTIALSMAEDVGPFLRSEGWLWNSFTTTEEGWLLAVSRDTRRFRDAETLDDYLQRRRNLLDGESVGDVSRNSGEGDLDMALEATSEDNEPDTRSVFIVHGRDLAARDALAEFLRALDLRPIDFEQMVGATGSGAPYVGEAVTAGFMIAQAVVVLLTPDDEARLHGDLHQKGELQGETELRGQARPNVLFEAGMAFAKHPDRTVIVEIGRLRPFSDVAGRHAVRLGSPASLNALATRLQGAGCDVKLSGSDWLKTDRFDALGAHERAPLPSEQSPEPTSQLPRGRILPATPKAEGAPSLEARLHRQGNSDYLLELVNRGNVRLRSVGIEIPSEAPNWHLITDILPSWPIETLEPRDYRRFPVAVTMGGPVVIEVDLVAITDAGDPYRRTVTLSVYG